MLRSMATILVIDDQEPIRVLLRTALEEAGHNVLEASNGRLGLALYRASAADLIITDIVMPELDGLEMMLDLTRNFLNVKVIAISGGLEGEPAQRGQAVGGASDVSQAVRSGKITQCRALRIGALDTTPARGGRDRPDARSRQVQTPHCPMA
jgi:two-component system response regulator (stage 0 sporulation protein F)